jgi:excisionase family DNA binding protein
MMSEIPIKSAYYTVRETAQYLNVSEKTVRRLIERGHLPTSDLIRKKLIPRRKFTAPCPRKYMRVRKTGVCTPELLPLSWDSRPNESASDNCPRF